MTRILSTYLFIKRQLNPALVMEMARFSVNSVEVFCSRGHFDYRSQDAVRELAHVLADHKVALHSVHAPTERDFNMRHESAAPLSISDPERGRRLEAVDEVKRALDMAEQIPFRFLVQHMGSSRDAADPRRFDAAFNSLEHLHIFAKQRGVTIALENTPGELATPENLRQFITDTKLTDLRMCFDFGHAHIGEGVMPSLEAMRERIVTAHVHDNHGEKDEHLAPFDGTIEWKEVWDTLPKEVPLVLELKEQAEWAEPAPASVALGVAREAFDKIEEESSRA